MDSLRRAWMTADPTGVLVLGLGIGGVLVLYGLRRVLLASSQAIWSRRIQFLR